MEETGSRRLRNLTTPKAIGYGFGEDGPGTGGIGWGATGWWRGVDSNSRCREGSHGRIRPAFGVLFSPTKSIRAGEDLFAWNSALLRLSPASNGGSLLSSLN